MISVFSHSRLFIFRKYIIVPNQYLYDFCKSFFSISKYTYLQIDTAMFPLSLYKSMNAVSNISCMYISINTCIVLVLNLTNDAELG